MSYLNGIDQYLEEFQFKDVQRHPSIKTYIENQTEVLTEAISVVSDENFWTVLPLILGVDSKLVLLRELLVTIDEFGFTDEQVLDIVEKDYLYYNKELCGYNLNDSTIHALIFKIK